MAVQLYEQMTFIEDDSGNLPSEFALCQNYPNPFNAATTIRYTLSQKSEITLLVYNLLGQQVETLLEGVQNPGEHSLTWDASHLPSGVYFARLATNNATKSGKMLLLR